MLFNLYNNYAYYKIQFLFKKKNIMFKTGDIYLS